MFWRTEKFFPLPGSEAGWSSPKPSHYTDHATPAPAWPREKVNWISIYFKKIHHTTELEYNPCMSTSREYKLK
jgi:hypothetical protein